MHRKLSADLCRVEGGCVLFAGRSKRSAAFIAGHSLRELPEAQVGRSQPRMRLGPIWLQCHCLLRICLCLCIPVQAPAKSTQHPCVRKAKARVSSCHGCNAVHVLALGQDEVL